MPGSATELATLANTSEGGGSLDVTLLTLSDTGNFALDSGSGSCATSTPTLASGDDCTIGVVFTPSAEGVYDGTLTVDSDATATAQRVVELSGASCGTNDKDVSQVPPVTASVTHVACQTITAGPYVIDGDPAAAAVEFLAGEMLILGEGFSVSSGDSFVGAIDSRLVP